MVNRVGELHRLNTQPRLRAPSRGLRAFALRYGFATVIVASAIALRLLLQPLLPIDAPIIVPLVAVMACAAFGGLGPALWAMLLGGVSGYVQYAKTVDPVRAFEYSSELRLFLLEGVFISAFGAWLHSVRRRAQASDLANAALERQMLDISDQERRRFGHDLHDGLGQQLTGIALLSETLTHRLQSQSSPHAEQASQISDLVSETIGWTRELARGLSPLTLESDGLLAAIEELGTRTKRLLNITCRIDCPFDELPIDEGSGLHVYRIIQEAISNSAKHGKARNVTIKFARTAADDGVADHDRITITVIDDGSGLSAKTVAKPGIGVRIMQYRANLIGATLSIARRSVEGGSIVSCVLPVVSSTASSKSQSSASSNGNEFGGAFVSR